jgi:hypothetical protein
MPSLSGSGANSLLIEIVRKTLEDANEKKDNTFSRFEKIESMDSNQLGVRWPIVVEDNASEVWRSSDGGDFAQSGAEVYKNLTVTHTRVYKAAEFTADIRQMDAQPEKVTPIIAGAVARANQRLKKSCNQFVFGDGSGEVARYSSGTGTTTITFTSTSGNFFGSSKIMKNGRYQFYDSTLATARNSGYVFTVQSVDRNAKQAVFDVAPTLSASDVLVPEGSVSAVLNGFANMINNTGNIHGQSRTTYPSLNAVAINAGSAPLSASLMGQIENTMAFKTGMERIGEGYRYIWSPVQRQAYLNLGYDLKQFVNDKAGNLDAGFDGTTFGNISATTDVDCPDDTVVCESDAQFKRVELIPIGVQTFPGGDIFWPKTASSGQNYADSFIVNIAGKMQVGCPNPRLTGARLHTLALPGGTSRHIA